MFTTCWKFTSLKLLKPMQNENIGIDYLRFEEIDDGFKILYVVRAKW
jgi:hypothetical protein